MTFIDRLKSVFPLARHKESQARVVTSINRIGQPVATPANYESFAHQGFSKNAVVYTAISKISKACSAIDWVLYEKKSGKRANWTELENHPLLDLWDKPNPMQSRAMFIDSALGFFKISGNTYIEANRPSPLKPPRELWPVRPDKMKIIPGLMGYPAFFEFSFAGQVRRWPVDVTTLSSDILHIKSFNPLNDWYGLSPLESALLSVDQYNAGQRWNLSLLQNMATPSGVLQVRSTDANPRGNLTEESFARLKHEFETNYQGSRNAGRPMLLEGGIEWKAVSLSPKDMDFINNKNLSAADIALVYGVPPEIMGLGTKTFANYKEARLAFYEETILPEMDNFRDSINTWLTPIYGDNLYLDYDKDDIEALVEKRESKYTSLQTSTFLTINEKREAAGFDEFEGGDVFLLGTGIYSKDDFKELESFNPEPIPPPANDTTPLEDDDEEMDDEDEDADLSKQNDINKIEYKTINLLNANEKRKSWAAQNRIRTLLVKKYEPAVEKSFKNLIKDLKKTADDMKGADTRLLEYALAKVITDWTPEIEAAVKNMTENSIRTFGARVMRQGKDFLPNFESKSKADTRFDSFVTEYVSRRSGTQITTITNTTQKRIKKVVSEWTTEAVTDGLSNRELADFIDMELGPMPKANADRIARTEVSMAMNNGSLGAAKALGIPTLFKEWVSALLPGRTRDTHAAADSTVIPIDDDFIIGGEKMQCPGDPSGSAENVINCACVLTYKNMG